jgi:hypothetical protein
LNDEFNKFDYDLSPERVKYYKELKEMHKKHESEKQKEYDQKLKTRKTLPVSALYMSTVNKVIIAIIMIIILLMI